MRGRAGAGGPLFRIGQKQKIGGRGRWQELVVLTRTVPIGSARRLRPDDRELIGCLTGPGFRRCDRVGVKDAGSRSDIEDDDRPARAKRLPDSD